jgi:hypothetical protein
MAQVSRPFQVALGVCVLFALLWFALLHRPGSGSSSSSTPPHVNVAVHRATSPVKRAANAATHATGSAAARHVDPVRPHAIHTTRAAAPVAHGPHTSDHAKGDAGARHAAPDAVSKSSSATRSSSVAKSSPADRTGSPVKAATGPKGGTTQTAHGAAPSHVSQAPGAATAPTQTQTDATPAMQTAVAAELKQHKVVLLLFWSSHSSSDQAVHAQVQVVAHKLAGRVAVHEASASQVGSFGSITRDIQIYQTPTLLIVNPKGQVTTLTGYTDAFAIEQAIAEAH